MKNNSLNNSLNSKKQFFNRWALNYDSLFPSVFYQAIHQRLLEYVTLPEKPNVLDLGCGTGRLLARLANEFPYLRGTGVDFSEEMIRQARMKKCARHRPRLIFVLGNAEALPFVDEQFNAVFNTISFLHYPNPEKVFSEVSRVLQPGGQFYLVDYAPRWETNRQIFTLTPGGIRLYSASLREEFGRQSGFNCVGHYYLLGPILLSKFIKKED